MHKSLHQFFEKDHQRIEKLFNKAIEQPDRIEMNYYNQFRAQLLKHIKMEEKILFPAARKANQSVMQEILPQYRLEHGAITALMVPPPTPSLIKVIIYILKKHNIAEEAMEGLYDTCEELTKGQTQELLQQLIVTEEVPIHPPNPAPIAIEAAKRALKRANYDFDEILTLHSD
ncbi:MAG: hemerythrin domain-containing protein [Bacteroidia bacterium]